jgi:chromosome segregation ATPase
MNDIRELNQKVLDAEAESLKATEESSVIKRKLQDTFKEFIAMDETMKQLRKEAIKGTDSVESRNVMLQNNLTKLTADFEMNSKELRSTNAKLRESEFELDQMMKELNSKGDALKTSTLQNSNLKTILEKTTNELRELQQTYEQIILQKSKIEADARQDNINNEHQKQDLKKCLKRTSEELDQITKEKQDLQMLIRTNKLEIESLKKQTKALSQEKEQLLASLKDTNKRYETDMSHREQKISELTNRINKDQITMNQVQEKKEQLMYEVTDLQNNLSGANTNAKNLGIELTQLKRATEEKINLLGEQIEKLNITKNNLVNDKKELGDKIKSYRQELRDRELELEETYKKFDEFQSKSGTNIASLEHQLKTSKEDNRILNKTNDDLKERYTETAKDVLSLKREREALQKKQREIESGLSTSQCTVQDLISERAKLITDLGQSSIQIEDLEKRMKSSLDRSHSLYNEFTLYKKNAETVMEDQTLEIRRLKEDLMKTHGHNKLLTYKKGQLESSLTDTETKLHDTTSKLLKETANRETLEDQLDQNRIAYINEKRMRVELERVQNRLRNNDANRVIGSWSDWKTRDRKLTDLATGLFQESTRLSQLVSLLPVQQGFGNETEFEWPVDIVSLTKKKK